ncbi:MAG: DUF1573 domain-containing protein [Chitinophagaceae bacterium]
MKKIIFSLSILTLLTTSAFAQEQKQVIKAPIAATTASSTLTPDDVKFGSESYDFGNVEEGPAAEHVFTFTNNGKENLVIQRVQPSCGCTTPDWSKDPIPPGKTGMIKASYGTQGRPGHFEKSMTVFTNAGTKMVTFKGTVEKAPDTSVPENNSLMRTN